MTEVYKDVVRVVVWFGPVGEHTPWMVLYPRKDKPNASLRAAVYPDGTIMVFHCEDDWALEEVMYLRPEDHQQTVIVLLDSATEPRTQVEEGKGFRW